MHIWVDADACPKVIKEILFRASKRTNTAITLVANQFIARPPSPLIKSIQVEQGFDVADDYIARYISAGDLLISADIPLAAEVISKGAYVITPRGDEYTEDNIQQRLTMRNFMEEMRNAGQASGGPAALSQADRQKFANALDRYLNAS